MSFLLGAFGKLAAGRRVRQLQAKMMRVQSRLRRATRQIETTSKMLETQKKMALNNLTYMQQSANAYTGSADWVNWFNQQGGQQLDPNCANYGSNALTGAMDLVTGGSGNGNGIDKMAYSAYQNAVSQSKAQQEMMIAQEKNRIEEYFENMNDMMLEPLKQEEDSLQTEKDSLESQIQLAQNDYEACKKMEQSDAKNLAPNYTGQG